MITITVKDAQVQAALARLQSRLGNLQPAMHDIGQALVQGVREHISTGQDWFGRAFAPNSAVTIARKGSSKPLVHHGFLLNEQLHYQASAHGVTIGVSAVQAAVLQFGAKKGAFGKGKGKRKSDIPWGDIPARPFMPIDGQTLPPAAQSVVLQTIADHLSDSATA